MQTSDEVLHKISMEHLGKHDYKDLQDKKNATSEGLAHKVSEQNKECTEMGTGDRHTTKIFLAQELYKSTGIIWSMSKSLF